MKMARSTLLKLGLIGDNIAASSAPDLHRLAGAQHGLTVQYDRLVPRELGADFDTVFARCAASGYRGINVTYPYKERAAARVTVEDPHVRAIGAVNTVLFEPGGPVGHNTDFSGFVAAYRAVRGQAAPGASCLIGTGGVGRALAFGLVALGAAQIRLFDRDAAKAEKLGAELATLPDAPRVTVYGDAEDAAAGAAGVLNGTPVGMVGHDGTPVSGSALAVAEWVFDAVYTPVETQFMQAALAAGLTVISGYELFFCQGVHAWKLFSGRPVDEAGLRRGLAARARSDPPD